MKEIIVVYHKNKENFYYSHFYYCNPNKTGYRIYTQLSTIYSYYTLIYNSNLQSLVKMFIVIPT